MLGWCFETSPGIYMFDGVADDMLQQTGEPLTTWVPTRLAGYKHVCHQEGWKAGRLKVLLFRMAGQPAQRITTAEG